MTGQVEIAALVPHAGAMVLLDGVVAWDADGIECRATSHRDPGNPLRRGGVLACVCGLEYALQAAALHGALVADGKAQPAGHVATLREVALHAARLDDVPGALLVAARLERQEGFGMVYSLLLRTEGGAPLAAARASIALPRGEAAP